MENPNNGSGPPDGPDIRPQNSEPTPPERRGLGGFPGSFRREPSQPEPGPTSPESPPLASPPQEKNSYFSPEYDPNKTYATREEGGQLVSVDPTTNKEVARVPKVEGGADVVLPEVGITPPEWWHPDLGDWEKVDRDPKERMVKGAAKAILYYDDELRYTDETRDKDESGRVLGRDSENWKSLYGKYEAALKAFETHSEQNRLYKNSAQVVKLIEDFRQQESDILGGNEQLRLNIYERDGLNKEWDYLDKLGVGPDQERHGLFSKEGWDKAVERKQEIEARRAVLERSINSAVGPAYLTNRDDQREVIEQAKRQLEEKKLEEARGDTLEKEAEWEKELGEPRRPEGYSNFEQVLNTRRRQEILRMKDRLRQKRQRGVERGRGGLSDEELDTLEDFAIDLDNDEEYNEGVYAEADRAADNFLYEADKEDAFANLIQPIINECILLGELVAERPDQFLAYNFAEEAERAARAQSIGPYAGERGEYIRRAFRNIQALVNEIVTRKETGISTLESFQKVDVDRLELTPGIDWNETRDTLVERKKWYTQSEFGTFRFNDQSAVTLRLGVAQFRADIIGGSNYYDQQQMLGDMQAFTKALRIINVDRLAKREGWTREQTVAFRDSLRHEGENGISLTLEKFWGDAIMMNESNGFYSQYWAKEGPGRLEDLLKSHDGYKALATHFLHTKYRMIYNLEGFRGGLVGKTQLQGALMEVDKKLLIEEMMQWELVGVPGPRRDRLIALRTKVETGEKLNSDEQKELISLEAKAREDLTTCQSEDEVINRFHRRDVDLSEQMFKAEDAYKTTKEELGKKVVKVEGKWVIKDEAGNILPGEEQERQINELKQLRRAYIEAKGKHDQVYKTVEDGLDLALKVDHVFGEAYELGPRKVRMDNGDYLSIIDIDKALRYAAMEEAQEEFKRKYGFKDNLALLRKRAIEWNGRYAEYSAVIKFWKFLDDLNSRRESLSERQRKWVEFYNEVKTRWTNGFKILEDKDELKKQMKEKQINVSERISPYQRILQMVPQQAIDSFVTVDVITDENNPNATQCKKRFDLAKGYEYTGLTVQQLPFVQRAWQELNRNGDNTVIGGRKFRDIKDMSELESVESFFLGRYAGTREGQDSSEAIEGALRGELPWLNKQRGKLAKTGRRGFVGSEHLVGTPLERNNQYIAATADTVYFDRVMGILAYQFATTDSAGKFNPERMIQGVPWNGTWGGNIEFDYPGYAFTNMRRVIGRFPKILRGAPIRESSLARYIGFKGLHEAVGNKMFSPTDPWVFETWGKVKDAGQKFQTAYSTSFNPESLAVDWKANDKLIDDSDNWRAVEHHLKREFAVFDVAHAIAAVMLLKSELSSSQQEDLVAAGIERWKRIILMLGPLAAMHQNLRSAEDSRLGLEMNDLYHNSFILPVLLSEGEGPERWQEGGLDAYDAIVEMMALMTLPKAWNGEDNFIGHEYRKVRAGRDLGDPKSPVLVRTN